MEQREKKREQSRAPGPNLKVREKLGGDVLGEGLEEELTGAEAAVAEAPQVT